MNVVIHQTAADLSGAGDWLAGAARRIARSDVLTSEDLAALKRTIANVRAALDLVDAETNATRTGLTIIRATWDDRNEIAAERRAAKGVA